jgi:hypothetical protein
MKTILSVAAASMALAEPLMQSERDRAMSHLHATRKQILDAISGLSGAQWNFKAGPDRWSVAETVEHIVLSEQLLMAMGRKAAAVAPPQPDAKVSTLKDEQVMAMLVDRSQKFQAPEQIRPSGKWPTLDAMAAEFRARRDSTIEFIQTTDVHARAIPLRHPVLGQLDLYQWTLLISGHSERHLLQIRETMADLGFPKR